MLIFVTLWLNFCSIFLHPVYVSVTNMDIDAQNRCISLSVRMFTDDLETVLHNKYHVHGWIGTPSEHKDSRRLLVEYVNERFSIEVNKNEKIIFVADSIVVAEDDMWFYMRGMANQTIKQVDIDNRLLTDFFSTQTNLVIINTGRNEIGHILNRRNFKIELTL